MKRLTIRTIDPWRRDLVIKVPADVRLRDVRRAVARYPRIADRLNRAWWVLRRVEQDDDSVVYPVADRAEKANKAEQRRVLSVTRQIALLGAYMAGQPVDDFALAGDHGRRVSAAIDALISRYGPDALVSDILASREREQATRTDHKIGKDAPISDGAHTRADADTHGGDGNSGEMDAAAETAAEDREGGNDPQESNTPDGESAETGGSAGHSDMASEGSSADAPCREAGAWPARQGDSGCDEQTAEMGANHDGIPDSVEDGECGELAPTDGTGEDADVDHATGPEPQQHHDRASGTRVAQSDSGGDVGSPQAASIPSLQVLRLRAAIRRLASLTRRSTRPTPKWDANALTRELISRRVALHRARQVENDPQGVMILPDMSGSCNAVSSITLACAEAVGVLPGVVVGMCPGQEGVVHVPSTVGDRSLVRRLLALKREWVSRREDWEAARKAGITYIIVLGDAHGHRSYEAARDAGIKVLWCDPNWDAMLARDTRGMIYEPIRDATVASIADAIERATRRAS